MDWAVTPARLLATTTAQWRTTRRHPIVDAATARAVVGRVVYRTLGEDKSTAAVADETTADAAVVDDTSGTHMAKDVGTERRTLDKGDASTNGKTVVNPLLATTGQLNTTTMTRKPRPATLEERTTQQQQQDQTREP